MAYEEKTMLTVYLQRVANELRAVRPNKADEKRNPDLDIHQIWLDDIEHTIKCQGLAGEQADEFRAQVIHDDAAT